MRGRSLGFAWCAGMLGTVACAPGGFRAAPIPSGFRVVSQGAVTEGVGHLRLRAEAGPMAVEVLSVALDRCTTLRAVKGFAGAIGRERTSTLLRRLDDSVRVLGGVNADFFLFTPPGVPTNAHVEQRRVVTGPNQQPVFAIGPNGRPYLGIVRVRGEAVIAGATLPVTGWNRSVPGGLAYFDRNWGATLDSATGTVEIVLGVGATRRVVAVDTLTAGVTIPPGGAVLVAGREASAATRDALLALQVGDPVATTVELAPLHPEEAVGGRPVVVRDSALTAAARDTVAFAVTRHPRTAVGVSRDGRRLWLVVVDGRQPGYSAGMSLAELGTLLRDLGAVEAINLDGGGSSAMVVRDRGDSLRIVNRPSDREGERPVANALAVVRKC